MATSKRQLGGINLNDQVLIARKTAPAPTTCNMSGFWSAHDVWMLRAANCADIVMARTDRIFTTVNVQAVRAGQRQGLSVDGLI